MNRSLAGLNVGKRLIFRVKQELAREFPSLSKYYTFSPVPGFMTWLQRSGEEMEGVFNQMSPAGFCPLLAIFTLLCLLSSLVLSSCILASLTARALSLYLSLSLSTHTESRHLFYAVVS